MEKTILIVEDVTLLRSIYAFDLEKAGYKILTAGNGMKALELAESNIPNLILLDVMMPGMDGIETCKRLKSGNVTENIPVVMISAKSQKAEVEEGLEAGAVNYLVKPVKFKVLLEEIIKHIGKP